MTNMDQTPNPQENPEPLWPWQTGDCVIDGDSRLWQRAYPEDVDQGWPWAYVDSALTVSPNEGSVAENDPTRPLRLLWRSGRLFEGCPIVDERGFRIFK